MSPQEKAKLAEAVASVFDNERDAKVEVSRSHRTTTVTVSKMYDFLPLTFAHLKKLSEIFETENFTADQESYRGCETCDYGSRYSHNFTFTSGE